MPGPHDALFKATFGAKLHAAGLIRALLPADVVSALDLTTLQRIPGSFVDETLSEVHSDVLFTVDTIDGRTLYVYVLLEHQSTVDTLMPLRTLEYQVRIWKDHTWQHGRALPLPPIVSVVVSHAAGGWTAATHFEQLVALNGPLAALAPYTPRFQFVLEDLRTVPDAELLGRAMTEAARAVLLALKHADTDPVAALEGVLELLKRVLVAEDGERVLSALMHYTFKTGSTRARVFELARKIHPRVVIMAMTAAEECIQEGLERGRQEGRAVLRRQLAHRFGALPEAVVARVDAGAPDDLARWAERLLDVATLDEVFSE